MQQHINWYALDATIYKYLYTHSKAAAQMIQQYNRQGVEVLAYRGSSIAYNVSIDIVYMNLRYTFWMVFGISFIHITINLQSTFPRHIIFIKNTRFGNDTA